jgi:hypothetical protein
MIADAPFPVHRLTQPSVQVPFSASDGMESTYPGAYTGGSAATVGGLQVRIQTPPSLPSRLTLSLFPPFLRSLRAPPLLAQAS